MNRSANSDSALACRGVSRFALAVAALIMGLLLTLAIAPNAASADSGLAAAGIEGIAVADNPVGSNGEGDVVQAKSLRVATRSINDDYIEHLPKNARELVLNSIEEASLNSDNDYVQWFAFTPGESGVYRFASSMGAEADGYFGDPYGTLYGSSDDEDYALKFIRYSNDVDDEYDYNFLIISPTLQAGETYYLACSSSDDGAAFYDVSVTAIDTYDLSTANVDYKDEVLDNADSLFDSLNISITSLDTDDNGNQICLAYQTDYEIEGWYAKSVDEYGYEEYVPCNGPTDPGFYRLVLKGVNPYKGTVDVDFRVLDSKNLKSYAVYNNEYLPYDGKAVTLAKLDPHFYWESAGDDGETSEEIFIDSSNYELTDWRTAFGDPISEAVEIGEYSVTLSGKGAYSGEVDLWFEIVSPNNLSRATVTVTLETPYYAGEEVGYSVEVRAIDGALLVEGTHYTTRLQRFSEYDDDYVDVAAVDSEGDYRVVIEPIETGGYELSTHKDFTLNYYIPSADAEYAYLPGGDVPELKIGEKKQVSINEAAGNGIRWFSFKPSKDGAYAFESSEKSADPIAGLFKPISKDDDEYGRYDLVNIASDDDGGEGKNFRIKAQNLKAGATYYLACGSLNDVDSYKVAVVEYDPYSLAFCRAWASDVWVGDTLSVEALGLSVEADLDNGSGQVDLEYGKHYTFVSWVNSSGSAMTATPTTAGSYYVRIKGLSPYEGTRDVPFSIKDPYDIGQNWMLHTSEVYVDGKPMSGDKLGLSLKFVGSDYFGEPLKPVYGKNYKVSAWYDWDDDPIEAPSEYGQYYVEVEGIAPYHGKTWARFFIRDPGDLGDFDCDKALYKLWYNGEAATCDRLGVKFYPYGKPGSPLTFGKDYVLAGWYDGVGDYIGDDPTSGPVSVGEYSARFEGTNSYYGSKTVDFEIFDPKQIDNYGYPETVNVVHDGQAMTFEKLGIELAATAEDGSKMLLEYGTHYELLKWATNPSGYDDDDDWFDGEIASGTNLSDIVDKGCYSLTFEGKDPYSGRVRINLNVVDSRDLRFARISGLQSGTVYHENFVVNPDVFTIDGRKLVAGTDYTLTLQRYVAGRGYKTVDKVTQPGRYRVLVEGKSSLFGGYSGETEQSFEVLADSTGRYNIANATISVLPAQTYAGRAFTPAPVVKLAGTTLVANKDYKVSYANNTNAGTATVTVTGIGFYKGSKSATFTINKAAGSIAIKAKSKKALAAKTGKKTTIKAAKAFKVTKNISKGKVTYKMTKVPKAAKKYIKVAKNGKITVKKGLKAGAYKIKVKATSAATANYNAATSKVITVKINVK